MTTDQPARDLPRPPTRSVTFEGSVDELVNYLKERKAERPTVPVDVTALAMVHGIMDSEFRYPWPAGQLGQPATPAWKCRRIRAVLDAVQQITEP